MSVAVCRKIHDTEWVITLQPEQKKLLCFILLVLGLGVGLWFLWFLVMGQPTIGIDDASIFKVYARNLSNGFGFVYQPGGVRVEGFTSMLYLLLLSSLNIIVRNLDWTGLLLSFSLYLMSLVLTVLIVWRFVQKETFAVQQWLIGLAAAWIAASPFYTIWLGIAQMDVSLWTCLVLACVLWCTFANRRTHWWYLGLGMVMQAALVLARPEGMLLAFVPVLALIAQRISNRFAYGKTRKRESWIGEVLLLFSWLAAVGGITAFRQWYFGWPLPNTYYAKVSPDLTYRLSEGINYFWSMLIRQPFLFLVIPLLLRLGVRLVRDKQPTSIIFLVIAILTMIPIFNGGDHFAGWRFYQPLWLLLGVGLVLYVQRYHRSMLERLRSGVVVPVMLLAFVGILVAVQPFLFRPGRLGLGEYKVEFQIAEANRVLGTTLSNWLVNGETQKPTVGVITAGNFALTYEGETYDLLGLNELSIAHDGGQRKGIKNHASLDPQLTTQKRPELLFPTLTMFGSVEADSILPQTFSYNDLFARSLLADEQLAAAYQPVWITKLVRPDQVVGQNTVGVLAYVRTEYLEQLEQNQLLFVQPITIQSL